MTESTPPSSSRFQAEWWRRALREGDVAGVIRGLEAGLDPNGPLPRKGHLPLMVAAPQPDCVRLLLRAGADPNAVKADEGWTPLMSAARSHVESTRLLLAAGARIDGEPARFGGALCGAAEFNPESFELLLEQGADVRPLLQRLHEEPDRYPQPAALKARLDEVVAQREAAALKVELPRVNDSGFKSSLRL